MKEQINRRSFLRSSAAVGAGLVLAQDSFGVAKGAKVSDINVALLGAGAQGQVLMNACLKIPGVRFKAVCDIWTAYNQKRASRMLKKLGQVNNAYTDYKEMLAKEKDLDAVIVATPDFRHADHAIACLNAGHHVYCEKEMSNTLESARKMVEAKKKTGKLLQIGHQRRSNPRYIHCYEKLMKDAKVLGHVTTINGQWNRSAKPDNAIPAKYHIDKATLEKHGFKSMHQFLNWRWYKGLGGGPIVDLGSHQIDIFSWFLGSNPKSVTACGGTDYYDKATHEWYDNVLAIYEYDYEFEAGKKSTVRAFYQTLTSNSNGGYYETFMGDAGTLQISEASGRGAVYREKSKSAKDWEKWVQKGYLIAPVEKKKPAKVKKKAVVDVRETPTPPMYSLPVKFNDLYHKPHLENFFAAVRGKAKLNCPAEVGYETAVAVLKANEAVEAARKLSFKSGEFHV